MMRTTNEGIDFKLIDFGHSYCKKFVSLGLQCLSINFFFDMLLFKKQRKVKVNDNIYES